MTFKQKDVFFSLLRFAVCGKTVNDDVKNLIDEECLVALYKLAKQHDLAHLIGYALAKNDLFGENSFLKQKFVQQMGTAVYRYEQLNYEYNKIIECLSEHGVKHVALKGSVIRKLYLEPWMRTSCDIDILVQESDLESTTNLLCEHLAYTRERLKTINELSLYSPNGVHLELHYDLTEGGRYGKQTLSNIWDFTFFDEDKKYLALTDEAFYLYHVAHMIKHFENGGCGIRPFVDLWLLNNKVEFNKQKRYELLKQEGLDKFSLASEKLSRVWLENEQTDSLTESMQAYVLTGGAFGTDENRVNIQQTKKGGKFKYILSRIFISKKELRLKYPILEKQPILTPFYHVRRWLKLIFIKKSRKQSFTEFSHTMEVDKMDVLQSKQMLKDLGIETD